MTDPSGANGRWSEREALVAMRRLREELDTAKRASSEPIAVIGMSCRFPGGADSPEAFWELLASGRDAISEVPRDRYDVDAFYDPDVDAPGRMVSRWGAFIDRIDEFDPAFFGMSPREAMYLDPQQRLLMEVTWEALERAGIPAERLSGSHTGVFVGVFNHDYVDLQLLAMGDGDAQSDAYFVLGGGLSFAAGRIAYHLGLHGPAMVIDTACSSSLVALHVACQSLRADECDSALVGGVTLDFSPYSVVGVSKIRALSPTGRSRTLDASADGFVRGEGCGVVVLKRLSRALADGDPVLAMIRGSAVNHDGRSSGLTAPNGLAQQDVERRALQVSGVAAEQVGYIEIHGTGTPLGDPIEFEALKAVYGEPRPDGSPLLLGSVKTNIGHLEPAAGVAALIKTILCLQHREIPPHANFEALNPRISLDGTPFSIPRTRTPFPIRSVGGPLIAAVGGTGLSGTNAHVLLEEAPVVARPTAAAGGEGSASGPVLVPLSARDPVALRELAGAIADDLDEPETDLGRASLPDIAFTTAVRRTHHPLRVALVAADHGSLTDAIRRVADGTTAPAPGGPDRPLPPVLVFSGQGGQWPGMGLELLEHEAVFRNALERCDAALRPHTGWSVIDELRATDPRSRLHLTEVAQPTTWALQVALAALWRSWGMSAGAVIGHSVGEIAAAHAAGILDDDQAAELVAIRGRVMEPLRGRGGMAAVELPEADVAAIVASSGGRISLAAVNSPTSVVLSGETAALEDALSVAQERGVFFRRLTVEYPFHSGQVEAVRARLVDALHGLSPRRAIVPIASTVLGGLVLGDECDAGYWGRNMVQGVRFGDAVAALLAEGFRSWIEVGPHPALLRNIRQAVDAYDADADAASPSPMPPVLVPSLRNGVGEREVMLGSLGTLYAAHHEVDWEAVVRNGTDHRVVSLPTYPWQRRRYWFGEFDPRPAGEGRHGGADAIASGHPLLGSRTRTAGADARLTGTLSASTPAWLADHRVSGRPVVPAAAFVEALLAAGGQGSFPVRLSDVTLRRPLVLSAQDRHLVELVIELAPDGAGRAARIASCPERPNPAGDRWSVHATANLDGADPGDPARASSGVAADLATDPDWERLDPAALDARLAASGLEYGPAFQAIRECWRNGASVTARLELPDGSGPDAAAYVIHPILLDAAFRMVAATDVGDEREGHPYVPVGVDDIRVVRPGGTSMWCRASVRAEDDEASSIVADLEMATADGQLVASIAGLRLRRVPLATFSDTGADPIERWWYGIDWEHSTPTSRARTPGTWLVVSDSHGLGTDLAVRLRAEGERVFLALPGTRFEPRGEDVYALDIRDAGQVSALVASLGVPAESVLSIAFLPALDATLDPTASGVGLLEAQHTSGAGLLNLVGTLDKMGITAALRVVTRGSQQVEGRDGDGSAASVGTALVALPTWDLGWAAVVEQPGAHGRCIDLDPSADPETTLSSLVDELRVEDEEDQAAIRAGRRYVPRLASRTLDGSDALGVGAGPSREPGSPTTAGRPPLFDPDGTCLITGGLGGIGLELARLAAARGAGAIALVGRSEPSGHAQDVVDDLRASGARVWLGRGDIADPDEVDRLLASLKEELPPLRTVIHAAGIVDDGVLVAQDWPRLRAVLAPKVAGAWNLHRATERMDLAHFVLFSSAASMISSPGQGTYMAANAALDALAGYRRALGLPAISIDWGAWATVGMVRDDSQFARRLERDGMSLIDIAVGMRVLERVVAANPVRIGVLPFDWATYVSHRTEEEIRPLVRTVTRAAVAAAARNDPERPGAGSPAESRDLGPQLRAATPAERRSLLRDVVEARTRWVLQFDADRELPHDRNLFELGLDSIMAMELGNALRRVVDGVSPNAPFSHSTIDALAEHLTGSWERSNDGGEELTTALTAREPALAGVATGELDERPATPPERSGGIDQAMDEPWTAASDDAIEGAREVPAVKTSAEPPGPQPAGRAGIRATGLLAGRSALVFGVADERSIGWGIARALREQGADVGVTVRNGAVEARVGPLAMAIGASVVGSCDVRDDRQIRQIVESWGREHETLDVLVDSVAFADPEDLRAGLANTGRNGFAAAVEVTAYSLVALIRQARPLLRPGASVIALSHLGAQKAVQGYGMMGVAKATLEAVVRYLAVELGPDGIRVNAISTGPIATHAAVTVPDFERMRVRFTEVTPMRTEITIDDVGETAVYLASDLSRRVTGEILFVDGGFNVLVPPA